VFFLDSAVLDLEELDPEDAEDDEEGAADEDNVPDGLEGGEEGLHHQLQPGGSVDHPAQQKDHSAAQLLISDLCHQHPYSSRITGWLCISFNSG
jgi:hypothetical protein